LRVLLKLGIVYFGCEDKARTKQGVEKEEGTKRAYDTCATQQRPCQTPDSLRLKRGAKNNINLSSYCL